MNDGHMNSSEQSEAVACWTLGVVRLLARVIHVLNQSMTSSVTLPAERKV